jgi:dihydroorotase
LNPDTRWTYDPVKGYSKSRNSPWAGQTMEGRAIATIVGGQLVFDVARGVLTS